MKPHNEKSGDLGVHAPPRPTHLLGHCTSSIWITRRRHCN